MMESMQTEMATMAASGPQSALGWLDLFANAAPVTPAAGDTATLFQTLLSQLTGGLSDGTTALPVPTLDGGAEQETAGDAPESPAAKGDTVAPEVLAYWAALLAGGERLPQTTLPLGLSLNGEAAAVKAETSPLIPLRATPPRSGEQGAKLTPVSFAAFAKAPRDPIAPEPAVMGRALRATMATPTAPQSVAQAEAVAASQPQSPAVTMPTPTAPQSVAQAETMAGGEVLVHVNQRPETVGLPDADGGTSFPQTTVPVMADTKNRGTAFPETEQPVVVQEAVTPEHPATQGAPIPEAMPTVRQQTVPQMPQMERGQVESNTQKAPQAVQSETAVMVEAPEQVQEVTASVVTAEPPQTAAATLKATAVKTTPTPDVATAETAQRTGVPTTAETAQRTGAPTPTAQPEGEPPAFSHSSPQNGPQPETPPQPQTQPTANTANERAAAEVTTFAAATMAKATKETGKAKETVAKPTVAAPVAAKEAMPVVNTVPAATPTPTGPSAPVSETTAAGPTVRTIDDTLTLGPQMVAQLSERIGLAVRRGESEWRLKIRPPALGEVDVRLTASSGGIAVQMRTETEAARGILRSHLDELRENLQDRGVRLESLSVNVTGEQRHANGFQFGQPRQWQGPEGQPRPAAYTPQSATHKVAVSPSVAQRITGSSPTSRLDVLV